ncbi:MAG TPA: hypothetical protein EYO33_22565 [Phycisphaerales bacterium]|nr:hypothetical protein [Phycisphaerales bacterium]
MRIHDRGVHDTLQAGIENNRKALQKLQEQIATGTRVNRASDDPSAYRQASKIEKTVSSMEQDRRLMDQGKNFLAQSDQVLDQLTQNVRALRSIVLERGSDGRGFQVADTLAIEADRLVESNVIQLNTEVNGTYLYSGNKSKTKPFEMTRGGGKIESVQYNGDNGYPPLSLPGGGQLKIPLNGEAITRGSGEDLMALGIEIRKAITEENFDSDAFLDRLGKVEENLLLRRSEGGSAGRHLERLDESLSERVLTLRKEYESLVGTDLTEAITSSLTVEVSLQASMQMAGKNAQLSLVNYLR